MRSVKNPVLSIFSLAALFSGAALLTGCGGGGGVQKAETVEVNGPALVPPIMPVIPNPHPLPPPEDDGTVPPPPAEPVEPVLPVDPPSAPLAPDMTQVRAMAFADQVLYVGDPSGNVWQRGPDGTQWAMFATTPYGAIEAMAHVAPRNALYLAQGGRLTRLNLETRLLEVVLTSGASQFIDGYSEVTGLAFNNHRLWGLDRAQHRVFEFPDLDLADTSAGIFLGVTNTTLSDLVYDVSLPSGGLLALDATSRQMIEIDHLGLTWSIAGTVPSANVQTIAVEFARLIVGIDAAWGALVRFEPDGTLVPTP